MLTRALAALLIAGSSACLARAQESGEPELPGEESKMPPPEAPPESPLAPEAPAEAMTLADARINLPTVVQAFVEKRTREGVWPLRDKATGRLRKLRLLALDAEKTQHAGEGLFAAPATLLDVESDERLPVVFTVDFSGTEWKVSKLRFVKKKAGRKAARSP